ncbi:hypothetical protein DVH26_25700 [Paenibacillus sp. H1-7]|nr:hypothetical protein DVH26_25700 [Paenibacillus sp. H1-7]
MKRKSESKRQKEAMKERKFALMVQKAKYKHRGQ